MKTNKVLAALPSSGIRRFFDLVSQEKDIISLGVGEPDFVTPWAIREASIFALEKGRTSYTSNAGLPELRKAISTYVAKQFNVSYHSDSEILITTGVSEAFDLIARAVLNPGDEVIIVQPCYVSYAPLVALTGATVKLVATNEKNNFTPTTEDIEKAVTDKTVMMVLNYPNNPTGAALSKKQSEEIAKLSVNHDLIVVSDEIYAELTYGNGHVSLASLPGMKERTLLLHGFSKSFAMTGFRIGYCAGPEEIISQMLKIHQYSMLCAPIMSQYAALEALQNGHKEMLRMKKEYDERRRYVVERFNKMDLSCFEPHGAFYAFPSIKKTGLSSEDFAIKLLEKEKVAVVPGTAFGNGGEGYIRCSYAASREQLAEALDRIERFVKAL